MGNIEALLMQESKQCGLRLTSEQVKKFQTYMELLLEWNTKINLTAIKDPKEFVEKHFFDSLWPLQWLNLAGKTCLDVGTGAGFPGIPLKLIVPQMDLVLLDSLQKRLTVLDTICAALQINAKTIHARAEEGSKKTELREQFDFVFARAVAPLSVLCEYCLPYVKVGGSFCAWKGPSCEAELSAAQRAIQILGGKVSQKKIYQLPDGSQRTFLQIGHNRICPLAYPRSGKNIKKQPL